MDSGPDLTWSVSCLKGTCVLAEPEQTQVGLQKIALWACLQRLMMRRGDLDTPPPLPGWGEKGCGHSGEGVKLRDHHASIDWRGGLVSGKQVVWEYPQNSTHRDSQGRPHWRWCRGGKQASLPVDKSTVLTGLQEVAAAWVSRERPAATQTHGAQPNPTHLQACSFELPRPPGCLQEGRQ